MNHFFLNGTFVPFRYEHIFQPLLDYDFSKIDDTDRLSPTCHDLLRLLLLRIIMNCCYLVREFLYCISIIYLVDDKWILQNLVIIKLIGCIHLPKKF